MPDLPNLSRKSLRVTRPVPVLWVGPRPVPDLPKGNKARTGPPRGSPDPSRMLPRVLRPIPDLPDCPLTHPGPPGWSPNPSWTSPLVLDPFRTSLRVPRPGPNFP